jgi:hypothetical protein
MNTCFIKSIVIISFSLVSSCASASALPESSSLIDFEKEEGLTDENRYHKRHTFYDHELPAVWKAAKLGLVDSDFRIIREQEDRLCIVGEHASTGYNFNIVVGIYFREVLGGVQVKIISQGSLHTATSNGRTEVLRMASDVLSNISRRL